MAFIHTYSQKLHPHTLYSPRELEQCVWCMQRMDENEWPKYCKQLDYHQIRIFDVSDGEWLQKQRLISM